LEGSGFCREDYIADDLDIWPCCWDSVLFMSTLPHGAWENGMNGKSRLDYAIIQNVLFDHFGIKQKHRRAIMADLIVMEIPALNAMQEK